MTRDSALFDDVPASPAFPALEQSILDHWRAADIQKKAMARSKPGKKPYVFFEGPPTANGRRRPTGKKAGGIRAAASKTTSLPHAAQTRVIAVRQR